MNDFYRKMSLLAELVEDWKESKIDDLAALTAATIIIKQDPITAECREWAIKVFSKERNDADTTRE